MDIISDYARLERKLGKASQTDIVSEAHQKITEIVKKAGGTYKPSGAGNGDMGVAFCHDINTRLQIEDVLQKSAFDAIDLSLQLDRRQTAESPEMVNK